MLSIWTTSFLRLVRLYKEEADLPSPNFLLDIT